jgi:hypothetical protein
MLKGWAKFMYEEREYVVAAGDCVHQRPGITYYLFDYAPNMQHLAVVGPTNVGTIEVESAVPVPEPKPW